MIEILKAKFDTVKLPKSFLAVNLSEKHAQEVEAEGLTGRLEDSTTDIPSDMAFATHTLSTPLKGEE